jgi:hypothetical protein
MNCGLTRCHQPACVRCELERKRDEYDHKAAMCWQAATAVFVLGMIAVCGMALLGI